MLEIDLKKRAVQFEKQFNIADNAEPGMTMIPDSKSIFQAVPGLRYITDQNCYVESSEFEKKLVTEYEGLSCLDFKLNGDADNFYVKMLAKRMTRVYTYPYTTNFHKYLVEMFKLSETYKSDSRYSTVCEGIIIKGKIHGTARIMIHDGEKVEFFMVGSLRGEAFDGECIYIKSGESPKWLKSRCFLGSKSSIDIEI